MQLKEYQNKTQQAKGKLNLLQSKLEENNSSLESLEQTQKDLELAQAFLQEVAQSTQEQLRYHISDIVQLALDTCFPGSYIFDILFEIKRGKTEAKLLFLNEGEEVDVMDAAGGGVVDVSAFALRIAAWTLGKTDNVIVLDEPFRCLSDDLQPFAAEVLAELSKELGLQFIIVTHRKEITEVADKIFEVELIDKVSKVTER